MGRGASRSKSGGMTVMKDSERRIMMKNSNISLFEFLQEGCFEKDFMAYCANRLNDFSCVHWLDPDVNEGDPLHQGNRNQTESDTSFNNCYHDKEFQSFYLMKLTKFIMPIVMTLAIVASALTIVSVNRIANKLFPLASYLSYLAVFDVLDLIVRGGDLLIEAFTDIRVLAAIQILTRSSCQMLPFFYNFFKHAHMSIYLAMAIDNWRFVKKPRQMYYALRYEWIRNVFIVIVAVLLTVNAQFFWTFDVTENDNKILHNRIVKNTFECSFSTTWPLAQGFTEYIWPIIDHTAGEILPTVVCLWFGASGFWSKTDVDKDLEKYIINLDLLRQMNYSISVISLLFGFFSIPRLVYFVFKYCYLLFLKTTNQAMKENIRSKIEYLLVTSVTSDNNEEIYLQYVEFVLKYVNFIFIIVKFLVLIRTVDIIRSRLLYLLTFLRPNQLKQVPRDCPKCSERSCESFLPAITYIHRSASSSLPRECVTLCSYSM